MPQKKVSQKLVSIILAFTLLFSNFSWGSPQGQRYLRAPNGKNVEKLDQEFGFKVDEQTKKEIAADQEASEKDLKTILGDYKIADKQILSDNHTKEIIDISDTQVKQKLERFFGGEKTKKGDQYHILYYCGLAIAIVKKNSKKELNIKPIVDDIANIELSALVEDLDQAKKAGVTKTLHVALEDYVFEEEQSEIEVPELDVVNYKRMADYYKKFLHESDRRREEIEKVQKKIKGEITDSDVANCLNIITDAYLQHAKPYEGKDEAKYYAYREITVKLPQGDQKFRVKLTKKETPKVSNVAGERMEEIYEWYVENITVDNRKGLNPSITFYGLAPKVLEKFGQYRDFSKLSAFAVLNPQAKSKDDKKTIKLREKLAKMEEDYEKFVQEKSGITIAGGKGLNLSLINEVFPVPVGFNITSTAYFRFVKENPELFKLILEELGELDTTNETNRGYRARKIRDAIKAAKISDEMEREILIMYRQINVRQALAKKKTPTAVAVRSSGIKEDLIVESWLPIKTGSQAGQSATFLNVRGEKALIEKVKEDWASLFTNQAVSYRDDSIYIIFSALMGFKERQPKDLYDRLMTKLRAYSKDGHPEFEAIADILSNFNNPGSVKLMRAMKNILELMIENDKNAKDTEDYQEIENCLLLMRKTADDFVKPDKIGIDVVVQQMVKSYLAGVLFTVNPDTKMAGVPQALYQAWFGTPEERKNAVWMDDKGNIIGVKPNVFSFEINLGYGETVVGGGVVPDSVTVVKNKKGEYYVAGKNKGSKLVQMINVEECLENMSRKMNVEDLQDKSGGKGKLVKMLEKSLAYSNQTKIIKGYLTTRLHPKHLLKDRRTGNPDKDLLVTEKFAEKLLEMILENKPKNEMLGQIKDNFYFTPDEDKIPGLVEENVNEWLDEKINQIAQARKDVVEGENLLIEYFNDDRDEAKTFIEMYKGENEVAAEAEKKVLKKLNLVKVEFTDLTYLLDSLMGSSFTGKRQTTPAHQESFCITDEAAIKIAEMGERVARIYFNDGKQRDMEFAIEIVDPSSISKEEAIHLYVRDNDGNILVANEKGELKRTDKKLEDLKGKGMATLKLFCTQARPWTSDFIQVDYVRIGTEVDVKFIEAHDIQPIATGTTGENAVAAVCIVYNKGKSNDWHAELIKRWQRGEFLPEEIKQLADLGFKPEDFGPTLPISIHFIEADPSHDPLMRQVNAVTTEEGGKTSHASIFMREQGKPGVCGTGKIKVDGRPIKTGDVLVVDAEHGNIYKLDSNPKKRIPILPVEQIIEFYAIPTDPDFPEKMKEKGWVTADPNAKQKFTPDFFAPDNGGNELERAEEKVNEIGINPVSGYTYDLLERIRKGEIDAPKRVYIESVLRGQAKAKGLDKFINDVNGEIYEYLTKTQNKKVLNEVLKFLNKSEYKKTDGFKFLVAFDILRDLKSGILKEENLSPEQRKLVELIDRIRKINQDSEDMLYYCYDCFQTRLNFDYNHIEDFNNHPWIKKEIEAKLIEKGYPGHFDELAAQEFYYFYNMMGFTTRPDKTAKGRAWDAASDKTDNLIGTTPETCRKSPNCLYGYRGTALEILGLDPEMDMVGNQKVTDFLIKQKIRANKNTGNQSFFYVFLRTPREAEMLKYALKRIKAETGELPDEIGFMGETASFALYAAEFMKTLAEIRDELGVKSVFVSFGTNDLTSSLYGKSRDNAGINIAILHPSAIKAVPEMKASGYFFNKNGKFPLADDGSPIVGMAIEAVAKEARKYGVKLFLCGERITNAADRGDDQTAGDTMMMLDGVGVSMPRVRLFVSMIDLDSMSKRKEITVPEESRPLLLDLKGSEIKQKSGIMKGEVIYVNEAKDLIPEVLKGYEGAELEKERMKLARQSLESLQSVVRTYNRIVVITKNLVEMTKEEFLSTMSEADFNRMRKAGLVKLKNNNFYVWTNLNLTVDKFSDELQKMDYYKDENARKGILVSWEKAWNNTRKGMEKRGIRWHELRYARAIIVDKGVDLEGWDVFEDQDVARRIKVKLNTQSIQENIPERQYVTIDYGSGKIYQGDLAVKWNEFIPQGFPILDHEPEVNVQPAVREDANNVQFKYHPLLLTAYKEGKLDPCDRIFSKESCDLLDELMEIAEASDITEKKSLLASFKKKVARISDSYEKKYLFGMMEKVTRGGQVDDFDKKFNRYVKEQVDKLMKISTEADKNKRMYELSKFENGISSLADKTIKDFFQEIIAKINKNEEISLPENWNEELQVKYFTELKKDIAKTLNGKSVDEFIKDAFKEQMRKVLKTNPGKFVVHKTISLDCVEFGAQKGAFLVETITPDPKLGLQAAPRGVADMSPITDLELLSFKEERAELLPEERNNFGLEISKVANGGIVIAWKYILRDLGIIPGHDGLQVGIEVSSAADTLVLEKYFAHFKEEGFGDGFTFASCEPRILAGMGWLTSDIYWNMWRLLIKDKELERTEKIAVKRIKGKLEEMNNADKSIDRKFVVFEDQMSPEELAKTVKDHRAVALAKSSPNLDLANQLVRDITKVKGAKVTDGEAVLAQQVEEFNSIHNLILSGDITFEDLANFLDSDKRMVETPLVLALLSGGVITLEQASQFVNIPEAIKSRYQKPLFVSVGSNDTFRELSYMRGKTDRENTPPVEKRGTTLLSEAGKTAGGGITIIAQHVVDSSSVDKSLGEFSPAAATDVGGNLTLAEIVKRKLSAIFNHPETKKLAFSKGILGHRWLIRTRDVLAKMPMDSFKNNLICVDSSKADELISVLEGINCNPAKKEILENGLIIAEMSENIDKSLEEWDKANYVLKEVEKKFGKEARDKTRVLCAAKVKKENAFEIMKMKNMGGVLLASGGKNAGDFVELVKNVIVATAGKKDGLPIVVLDLKSMQKFEQADTAEKYAQALAKSGMDFSKVRIIFSVEDGNIETFQTAMKNTVVEEPGTPLTADEISELHKKVLISLSKKGDTKDQIIELTEKLTKEIGGIGGTRLGISDSEKYFVSQNRMFDVIFELIKNKVIGSKIVIAKGIYEDKIIEAQIILSLAALKIISAEKAAVSLGIEKSVVEEIVSIYNQGGGTAGGFVANDYYLNFVNRACNELAEKQGITIELKDRGEIAGFVVSKNIDGLNERLKGLGLDETKIWLVRLAIANEVDKSFGAMVNPSLSKDLESPIRTVVKDAKELENISGLFVTEKTMEKTIGLFQSTREFAAGLTKADFSKVKVYVEGDAEAFKNLGLNVEAIGKISKDEIKKRVGDRFVVLASADEEIAGIDSKKIVRLDEIKANENKIILAPFALIKALKQLIGGDAELEGIALSMLKSLQDSGCIGKEVNLATIAKQLIVGNTVPAIAVSKQVGEDRRVFEKLAEKA